jgi:hypothetical protein
MSPAAATAQGVTTNPVEINLVGGLNIAKVTSPLPEITIPELTLSSGTRVGFVGGVLVDVPLSDILAVETGGLLSVKGVTFTASFAGVSSETDVRMAYLDVPGLIRVKLGQNESVKGFLLAGATLGFHLTSSGRTSTAGFSVTETLTDLLNPVDLGFSIGGRVQFGRIIGDVRYTFGLLSVLDTPADVDEFLDASSKHRVLSFMGGWRF